MSRMNKPSDEFSLQTLGCLVGVWRLLSKDKPPSPVCLNLWCTKLIGFKLIYYTAIVTGTLPIKRLSLNPMNTFQVLILINSLKCLTLSTKPSIFKYYLYFVCVQLDGIRGTCFFLVILYNLPPKSPLPIHFHRALS